MFFSSLCHYLWFWGGSTWVLLGKCSSNFKFKYGPSCFLIVFVVIFEFEVGVPWFYLVNLHQFSSLSMADHVFHQFMSFYWFWGGSTWVLLGKSFSIFKFKHGWSCFLTVCHYFWFWGGSTWVLFRKSSPIFKFKHGWSCFLTVLSLFLILRWECLGFIR